MRLNYCLKLIFIILCFISLNIYAITINERIVAVVNGSIITKTELEARYKFLQKDGFYKNFDAKELLKRALNDLIEDRLLLSYAKSKNIKVASSLIKKRIEKIKKDFTTELEFLQYLERQGLDYDALYRKFENEYLVKMIIDREIKAGIRIHPSELLDFYERNIHVFQKARRVKLKKIYLKENSGIREKLRDIKYLLDKGTDFDELAKNYNEDQYLYYGENGWVEESKLNSEIREKLSDLKVGEISEPIKIEDGYYIFQIVAREGGRIKFEEVHDKIYRILYRRKFEARYQELIERLKKNSEIEIRLEL